MSMVCAQCGQVFHGKERQCPRCGILLLVQQHGVADPNDASLPPPADPLSRWQQTPWGRIVVSVLLAQGLAFCIRMLFTAWYQAREGESIDWNTPSGLLLLNAFHAVCLVAAGMLAGANQIRGIASGGLVGLWSGLIFLALNPGGRHVLAPALFFAQPLLHLAFGLIGGFIGYRIWKPTSLFVEDDMGRSGLGVPRPGKLWKGPIHIVRVLLGAGIAVTGAIFAKEILGSVLDNSQGLFRIRDNLTERLLLYQVMGLSALVGGAVAGSSSRNGFKQGVCASVLVGALFIGVQLANPKTLLEVAIATGSGVAGMTILGGVFGSTLFPPLVKQQPKNAIPY